MIKKSNDGFSYNVPTSYCDMFEIYQGQISRKAVDNGKRKYSKHWNLKGKTRIQNMR